MFSLWYFHVTVKITYQCYVLVTLGNMTVAQPERIRFLLL